MCAVEWKSLEELGNFYGGLSGKSKEDFQDGNAKFVTYMNVYSNMSLDFTIVDMVKVGEDEKQNSIKYGDILFTGSSETPDDCGMSCVVTRHIDEPIYLNSFCFGFRFDDVEKFEPDFLKHYFRCTAMRKAIALTASGVTRFNVSKKRLGKVQIPILSINEQREIGKNLDTFTTLISNLESELHMRRKQYEHYRNQLLDFDGVEGVEWNPYAKVGTITDYVSNGSFADLRNNVEYKQAVDYAILVRTVDFSTNFDKSKLVYIDENAYEFLNKSKLFGGEIIINNIGAGVGSTFICPQLGQPMSLAPNAIMLNTPNNKFYYYWFVSKYGQDKMMSIVAKSAMPKFNKTGFKGLEVPIPSSETQQEIVSKLDAFENLIQSLEQEIKLRKQQYEYYREKLLTFEKE